MNFGASPEIFIRAKELRKNMTKAEKLLWQELNGKKFGSYKFRNQHPISKFIIDFYCHKKRLGIEIDGAIQNTKGHKFNDNDRTGILNDFGITILRFKNEEVFNDLEKVKSEILKICKEI